MAESNYIASITTEDGVTRKIRDQDAVRRSELQSVLELHDKLQAEFSALSEEQKQKFAQMVAENETMIHNYTDQRISGMFYFDQNGDLVVTLPD